MKSKLGTVPFRDSLAISSLILIGFDLIRYPDDFCSLTAQFSSTVVHDFVEPLSYRKEVLDILYILPFWLTHYKLPLWVSRPI